MPKLNIGDIIFFFLLSIFGYSFFLGAAPLFDWDEINFAESAREMIESGNYFQVQVNFEPFWEKPPLFFWMQSLSMHFFGVNEFAARFPNVIIGISTVLCLYVFGTNFGGRLFGRVLTALYMGSLLPSIYFKTGIIDPTFNFFIFLGLIQLFQYESLRKKYPEAEGEDYRPWSVGIFFGLATLTKGPVAIVIGGLTYLIYKLFFDRDFPFKGIGKMILAFLIIIGGWYGLETMVHGPWFIEKFIEYQIRLFTQEDAGHGQPFYYHFVVFCLGCFPISIFAFRGMFQKHENQEDRLLKIFMTIWFWVVMLIFSLAKTKIVHYSSLLYYPGAFLAALYLVQKIKTAEKVSWDVYVLFALGMLVWGIAPAMINFVSNNLNELIQILPENKEKPFVVGNLTMEVEWSGYEWIIGGLFLIGLFINLGNLTQRKYISFVYFQIFLTLFLINAEYKWVLPKVARYTQGANMDFFEKLQGKDVYYLAARYKSYVPYFYGKIQPQTNPKAKDVNWFIEGEIDKDVYVSVKNILIDDGFRAQFKHFTKLYEQGGFVFYVRKSGIESSILNKPLSEK
jgi:4-amino-4-deoxy-L-arabinose transferase-like glycosyltransferase